MIIYYFRPLTEAEIQQRREQARLRHAQKMEMSDKAACGTDDDVKKDLSTEDNSDVDSGKDIYHKLNHLINLFSSPYHKYWFIAHQIQKVT